MSATSRDMALIPGSTVARWLAVSPPSKKVFGLISRFPARTPASTGTRSKLIAESRLPMGLKGSFAYM